MRSPKDPEPQWRRIISHPVLWISIAILPAVIIFSNRVLIPDMSTDVISYHLFNGLRGLTHPLTPFLSTEFYPTGIANIPSGLDSLNTLMRLLIGYRLGTILSLLSMVIIAITLYKILELLLAEYGQSMNVFWGLLLVNSLIVLELYFQLATYFIDNINSALLLLLFYLSLRMVTTSKSPSSIKLVVMYLALGFMIALKLTNLPFVIPTVGLLLWSTLSNYSNMGGDYKKWKVNLALSLLVVLPIIPLWFANYSASHNPMFPFYNQIFQSPFYPLVNFTDTTFGGVNAIQRLLWPLLSLRDQLRLGEPHHIYNDYKLVIYWIIAVAILGLHTTRTIRLKRTSFIIVGYFLTSLLLWGLLFGINRYATSSIALGGLVIVVACLQMPNSLKGVLPRLYVVFVILAIVVLGVESFRILKFNINYDMSWRPPLSKNKELHRSQLSHIFDKQLQLSEEQSIILEQSDIALNCHTNVAGLFTLMPHATTKPVINIIADGLPHYRDMADNTRYRTEIKRKLPSDISSKKTLNWFSIISKKDIGPTAESCQNNIISRGGIIIRSQPLDSFLGYKGPELLLISGTIRL